MVLQSRCQHWRITPPSENEGLTWIKNKINHTTMISELNIRTALRLSYGAPYAAIKLLKNQSWKERKEFYDQLNHALNTDVIILLPLINNNKAIQKIEWLSTLLGDALKWHYGINYYINADYYHLVYWLGQFIPKEIIAISFNQWLTCKHYISNVGPRTRELYLIEQLLNWKKLIIYAKKWGSF
ncbi:MAG: DNA polymerase III subunit delta' C-terminal domain-containing protein [Candidatus Dasytiphilus stammeri]